MPDFPNIELDSSALIVAVVSAVITAFFSLRISTKQSNHQFIMERHIHLIAPLYFMVEPVLFHKNNYENTMLTVNQLISENLQYLDGEILTAYKNYQYTADKYQFFRFCDAINHQYDMSCRKLGLKVRPIRYKIKHKQYSRLIFLIFDVVRKCALFLFLLICIAFLGAGLIRILMLIPNVMIQITLGILFFIFIAFLSVYLSDRFNF